MKKGAILLLFSPMILLLGLILVLVPNSATSMQLTSDQGVEYDEAIRYQGLQLPPNGELMKPCEGFNGNLYGQCTAWVCFRSLQLGHPIFQPAGNGEDVVDTLVNSQGWISVSQPEVHAVVSFWNGNGGHVAIVEQVLADGSWITSDMNVNGDKTNVYQITHAESCSNCTFAVWKTSLIGQENANE
jgi:surface antigen